ALVAAGLARARRAGRGDRHRAHVRQRGVGAVRERGPGPRRAPAAAGGVLMLHAVVSDVHANLEALEIVLGDIAERRAADIVCLGDFVGYGACPNECVALLAPRIEAAVLGNHDEAALHPGQSDAFNPDAARAARWTAEALSPEHRRYLTALPYSRTWRGARPAHASPSAPAAWSHVFRPAGAGRDVA